MGLIDLFDSCLSDNYKLNIRIEERKINYIKSLHHNFMQNNMSMN